MPAARSSITPSSSVHCRAAAAGVTNVATISTTPTATSTRPFTTSPVVNSRIAAGIQTNAAPTTGIAALDGGRASSTGTRSHVVPSPTAR